MSSVKYQIFLSSTYEDLKDHRAELSKAVLSIGHIPVGMEGFNAADDASWDLIKRQIDECDYYVVVIAHNYGSTNEDGISYTELEYDYALSQNVPCLGFQIDEKAPWPAELMESDTGLKASLIEFKNKVKQKQIAYWTNQNDLATQFLASLVKVFNSRPRPGWIRADQATSLITSTELARLSSENAKLKKQVDRYLAESEIEEGYEFRKLANRLRKIKRTFSVRFRDSTSDWEVQEKASLFTIFTVLAPRIIVEDHIKSLSEYFPMYTELRWKKPEDKNRELASIAMPYNIMQDWMSALMTFGLVKPSSKRHAVTDKNEYWTLDETGVEFLKHLRMQTFADLGTEEESSDDGTVEESVEAIGEVKKKAKRRVKRRSKK